MTRAFLFFPFGHPCFFFSIPLHFPPRFITGGGKKDSSPLFWPPFFSGSPPVSERPLVALHTTHTHFCPTPPCARQVDQFFRRGARGVCCLPTPPFLTLFLFFFLTLSLDDVFNFLRFTKASPLFSSAHLKTSTTLSLFSHLVPPPFFPSFFDSRSPPHPTSKKRHVFFLCTHQTVRRRVTSTLARFFFFMLTCKFDPDTKKRHRFQRGSWCVWQVVA